MLNDSEKQKFQEKIRSKERRNLEHKPFTMTENEENKKFIERKSDDKLEFEDLSQII